jgi:LacI family transcriptional regulator
MRNIALCMELSDFYEHGIARGVVRYAKAKPDWRIYGYGWMFRPLPDIARWKGDGVIARVEDSGTADRLAALGAPVVDVAGAYARPNFTSVTNDDRLTGERAASHLLACGFRRFAFLGVAGTRWSEERRAGFEAALEDQRRALEDQRRALQDRERRLARRPPAFERSLAWWERGIGAKSANTGALASFLSGLERPAAIFACNDTTGLRATELAGRLGIAVPESLAILGVDNEDILCELSSPSLSSIQLDCEAIGFRAAGVLDAMLGGAHRAAGARRNAAALGSLVTLPPKEVIERESTRVFDCEDKLVAAAVGFIRTHAHEGIDVSDVLAVAAASRRSLEQRFRAAMGRSLHDEILAAKLRRAKLLLRETSHTLDHVAEESGFGALQRFHAAFKKAEGLTPGEWRRRNGA